MGKAKIGKDILEKKGSLISTPTESEEFEKFREERERQKKLEEIRERMKDEGQPSDEELVKAKAEEMARMAEWKEKDKRGRPE